MTRMGIRAAIWLAAAGAAYGAVGNVAVKGVTSTQAILTYTAPDTGACSVEVSESPTYRPLVHDVDPALFAGANLDSRAESTSSGRQRVFAIGKRRAEKGLDGHWYSRALQTVTAHYYRISCGSSVATGSFQTSNIPLGNTYNEGLPADPAVSTRPYYAGVGSYAWPEFIKWDRNDPSARQESVIDPQTGLFLKRMVLPQEGPWGGLPGAGEHDFTMVRSPDGAWSIESTAWSIANGKLTNIVVGQGSATVTTLSAHGLSTGNMVALSGLASGNGVYRINSVTPNSFTISQGSLPANTTLTGSTLTVTAYGGTADNGNVVTFSGANSNFLQLRDDGFSTVTSLTDVRLPMDYMTVLVKGWCSGTCAGEDAKIQACVTINGVTCWPTNATARYQEAALGTSQTSSFVTLGSTVPILDAWTPAGFLPLNRAELSSRSGKADVSASGQVAWSQATGSNGTYFSPNWIAGSRIKIEGSECTISGPVTLKELTIDPASCSTPLALPLTGASWSANNFGFLIRKKTASTDTIKLQYAKYTTGSSQNQDWTASGSQPLCGSSLVRNSVTKADGYHCAVTSSGGLALFWVERTTGNANYLGDLLAGISGTSGTQRCWGNMSLTANSPTDAPYFYCVVSDPDVPAKQALITCNVLTTNQPKNLSFSCSNLTPASQGKDLNTLIAQFTTGYVPVFDPQKFTCKASFSQGTKLLLTCSWGPQDTMAWVVVFDPFKAGAAAGCVGGGKPGCVVAATTTWATKPARWCVLHSLTPSGNTNLVWMTGNPYFGGTSPLSGPYTANITSGQLTATPAIAAGSGACPSGSKGCDQVTVDGEPCDPSPAAGEAESSPCPKNPSWAYLQDAQLGDYFKIDNEFFAVRGKNGNLWTLERGAGLSAVAAHSSTALNAHCSARDFSIPVSNSSWTWDSAADPHAQNAGGTGAQTTYEYSHVTPRPSVTVGAGAWYDSTCGTCYAVRDGVGAIGDPPNRWLTIAPAFAGATGPSAYGLIAQVHTSYLQEQNVTPPSEQKWFLDGRPLLMSTDFSDAAIRLSGSLYRMTSTATDGDTLRKLGNNLYVTKTSATSLLAAGNCSTDNPCPIRSSQLIDSITKSCTVELTSSGSGTIWVARLSTGGLGIIRSSGITVTSDNCPVSVGTGYPSGSNKVWSWGVVSGAFAANGSDDRDGASGYLGVLNRKLMPTWAYCGTQPMIDVSSSATGDVLSDTPADSYKYCIARKAGECRASSQMGDIYMNCPNAMKRSDGSYGCAGTTFENLDTPVDMCIGNHSAYLNAVTQMGFARTDFKGELGRSLTKGLGRYKLVDQYFHAKALPDASWIMTRTMWVNGAMSDVLLAKTPPFPPSDTVDRTTFIPIPVKLAPPAGLAVDNAVVQFGYSENGNPMNFYCTSRQEKCLANASTVPAVPFLYASEGAGGVETGVGGLSCANGCTVAVPAISQRILYYQVKYRDSSNRTVATGQVELVAVP